MSLSFTAGHNHHHQQQQGLGGQQQQSLQQGLEGRRGALKVNSHNGIPLESLEGPLQLHPSSVTAANHRITPRVSLTSLTTEVLGKTGGGAGNIPSPFTGNTVGDGKGTS
jgi:hypothetical protein